MRRLVAITGLAVLMAWSGASRAEVRAVVIVGARDSLIETVTPYQVRLSFLAVPVRADTVTIKPVLNTSDPLLHEVFLQKAMYLSDQHYRRRVLSQVFHSGGARPAEATSNRQLIELLLQAPNRISYMWERDARNHGELKILQVLWQGSIQ